MELEYTNILNNTKLNNRTRTKHIYNKYNIYNNNPISFKTINDNKRIGSNSYYYLNTKLIRPNDQNKNYTNFKLRIISNKKIGGRSRTIY